jgi:hypothetical protein
MKKILFKSIFALAVIAFAASVASSCKKKDVRVTGVSLNKSTIELVEGATETLTATVLPADAANKAVMWSSSDEAVASVDQSGKVAALKAGTADIAVTTADGGKTAVCKVTVTAKPNPEPEPLAFADDAKYDIPAMTAGVAIAPVDLSKAVSGGKAPYTFSLSQGSVLPAGLTLDPATGVISGAPIAVTPAGTASITAEDSSEPKQRKEIAIDCGSVALPLAMGTAGDDIAWILYEDGTMTIDGTGAMPDYEFYNGDPAPWSSHGDDIKKAVIGAGVTEIGDYAFYGCTALAEITIPNSVTTIGESAFQDCASLTEIAIPDNVTEIGDYAFHSCDDLTAVTLGNGVTAIGSYAFENCASLTEITIPADVTAIGHFAFENCPSLEAVTCLAAAPPTLGADSFFTVTGVLYVPAGSADAYMADPKWNAAFAGNIVEIP